MRMRKGRSLFGEKLLREMSEDFRRLAIEQLPFAFAAVATDLETGRELTVQTGPLARAVAASGAFPLLFPPVRIGNRWAVDGCLVNPVPVSTCRALGADLVIAVRVLDFGEKLRVTSEARNEAERWSDLLVAGNKGGFDHGMQASAAPPDESWSESRWARVTAAILRRLRRSERSARPGAGRRLGDAATGSRASASALPGFDRARGHDDRAQARSSRAGHPRGSACDCGGPLGRRRGPGSIVVGPAIGAGAGRGRRRQRRARPRCPIARFFGPPSSPRARSAAPRWKQPPETGAALGRAARTPA